MTRKEKVEKLIQNDIYFILRAYTDFGRTDALYKTLSGEDWLPYNQLTDEQIDAEYNYRFEEESDE